MSRMKTNTQLAVVFLAMTVAGSTMVGQTVSWIPVTSPYAQCCTDFVYDRANQSTVMFGGANGNAAIFGDNPLYKITLLFGEDSSRPVLGDTWLLALAP